MWGASENAPHSAYAGTSLMRVAIHPALQRIFLTYALSLFDEEEEFQTVDAGQAW
jgi:hypothetical protein